MEAISFCFVVLKLPCTEMLSPHPNQDTLTVKDNLKAFRD